MLKKIQFKIALMKDGHIFLLYADPEKIAQPTCKDLQHFDSSSDDQKECIKLSVGLLRKTYISYFDNNQPFVQVGKSIFMFDTKVNDVRIIRYQEHSEDVALSTFAVDGNDLSSLPSGDCIFSRQSKFYRSDLSNMHLSPEMKRGDECEQQHHTLLFPKSFQMSYKNYTLVTDLTYDGD